MKHSHRHLPVLVTVSCAILAASQVLGQDCACHSAQLGVFSDAAGLARPDFIGVAADGEHGPANNVAGCTDSFCGYSCRSEGLVFAAEVFFVDVRVGSGNDIAARLLQLEAPTAPVIGSLDPSGDPSTRFSLGWQTCDGLGVRARFWEFDNQASRSIAQPMPTDPSLVLHAWDVTAIDVEVTLNSMRDQVWDASLSGGYRFVNYEEGASLRAGSDSLASVRTRYIGNGLTGAAGLRRQLTRRLSVMGNVRASLLFGGTDIRGTADVTLPANALGDSFDARYILESQIGASYEHPICGGGYWFARGGYEVQYWNDFVVPLGNKTDFTSVVFDGVFVAVGLQR